MRRRVITRPRARRDLVEYSVYIGERSDAAAHRFLDAAHATFNELSAMPEMGTIQHFLNPRFAGIRRWRIRSFEKYLVFYRPLEDGIEVVRVIHGARDIESIFEDTNE